MGTRALKIFLSYAREDDDAATQVYDLLVDMGHRPWLDKKDLVPGQDWDLGIRQAMKDADLVFVFLSSSSLMKRGYIQREYKLALEFLEETPQGEIAVIPLRTDNCMVPQMFEKLHWLDLFESDGLQRLKETVILVATESKQTTILNRALATLIGRTSKFVRLVTDMVVKIGLQNGHSCCFVAHIEKEYDYEIQFFFAATSDYLRITAFFHIDQVQVSEWYQSPRASLPDVVESAMCAPYTSGDLQEAWGPLLNLLGDTAERLYPDSRHKGWYGLSSLPDQCEMGVPFPLSVLSEAHGERIKMMQLGDARVPFLRINKEFLNCLLGLSRLESTGLIATHLYEVWGRPTALPAPSDGGAEDSTSLE